MFSRGELKACMCGIHPRLTLVFAYLICICFADMTIGQCFSKKGSFARPRHTVGILFNVTLAH